MPLRSDWSGDGCPIARGIEVVGDPWVLLILREALAGAHRFDEFKQRLGIADNVLANRLKGMVEAGLLAYAPYAAGRRARHQYEITPAGADTLPILHAYAKWAEAHTPTPGPERELKIICRSCGARSSRGETCSNCGEPLVSTNVTWIRPGMWHGARVDLVGPADAQSPV